MTAVMPSPAEATYWFIPGSVLFQIIPVIGLACFAWIILRRLKPMLCAQRDPRFGRPLARLHMVLRFWLGQWRHPRYLTAGLIHIFLFAGFLILAARAFSLLFIGVDDDFVMPGFSGSFGHAYEVAREYAATAVLLAVTVAAVRRLVFRPVRYAIPPEYGRRHAIDAIFLLGLIGLLMLADGVYEASRSAGELQQGRAGHDFPSLTLSWSLEKMFIAVPLPLLTTLHLGGYLVHELTFFFLLCYRPFGIQFHVETSLFSIYFARLRRGVLKPVWWGVSTDDLDQVKSLGVKTFEDFTWKHILDFYSCADCGRCSDQCPANAVGRPLSPRFFSFKGREYAFRHYPMLGRCENGTPLVGTLYSQNEIWSCTTCGACEAECPLLVEYIDKIVDLRRGLVDEGKVPQSLQKALKSLESRGNPFGKPEKKRADWAANKEFREGCPVRVVNGGESCDTLYFVDSITSYDDRAQAIGRATARILDRTGMQFGILGAGEKDTGHDVRRFGEEMLFSRASPGSGVRQTRTLSRCCGKPSRGSTARFVAVSSLSAAEPATRPHCLNC